MAARLVREGRLITRPGMKRAGGLFVVAEAGFVPGSECPARRIRDFLIWNPDEDDPGELRPLGLFYDVPNGSSDSASLDSVFEMMVRAGRSAPMAKTVLVPEAWSKKPEEMPQAWRDMYNFCNAVMEPWDGPAALVMTDGRWVCAGMDRNGLRPMRYTVTSDGIIIAGSETGMVPVDEAAIVEKGALGPGQMVAVDLLENKLCHDAELKDMLAASRPFAQRVSVIEELESVVGDPAETALFEGEALRRRQMMAGFTLEELETVLAPMAEDGKEAVASMGDDTPPAVLSSQFRPLSHYFRQNFSQVTNPPIDSLREHRVMSLRTRFGNLRNLLEEDDVQVAAAIYDTPFLSNAAYEAVMRHFGDSVAEIDCSFPADGGPNGLQHALDRIRSEAEDAVRSGYLHLSLSDMNQSSATAPVPMILAVSAVNSRLTQQGLRTFVSLNVRASECVDPHYFAVLVGCGATTVNAYLAQDSIAERINKGLIDMSLNQAVAKFREAIDQGLLKIMSKMGISVISSYRGGLNFEAVGLSRAMAAEFFPGMQSRVSGIGISGLQRNVLARHERSWKGVDATLPVGGFYKARHSGEVHAWEARSMHMLQSACDKQSYALWKKYSERLNSRPPMHLRDLLEISAPADPVDLQEVESVTAIRKRFVTPGMSLGALSPEAHRTLNVAMNRIGARSDSGEGGEDPAHFVPDPNGDNPALRP